MPDPQTSYPLDLAEMVDWVLAHTPSGGRVLEIGAGDGAITHRLAEAGLDIVGVDPNGPPDDPLITIGSFEEFDAAPFDTIFASVSLHHLHDLAASAEALQRLSKPGTVMLVREFDREIFDDATLRWWFYQRHAREAVEAQAETRPQHNDGHDHGDGHSHDGHGHQHDHGDGHSHDGHDHGDGHSHDGHGHQRDHGGHRHDDGHQQSHRHHRHPDTFDEFVVLWRAQMESHVHPWALVADTLHAGGFDAIEQWPTAYLFRWGLQEELRPLEERHIADGRIKQVGIRWHGRRSS